MLADICVLYTYLHIKLGDTDENTGYLTSWLWHFIWYDLQLYTSLEIPNFHYLWLNKTLYYILSLHSSADKHIGWINNLTIKTQSKYMIVQVSLISLFRTRGVYTWEQYSWILWLFYFRLFKELSHCVFLSVLVKPTWRSLFLPLCIIIFMMNLNVETCWFGTMYFELLFLCHILVFSHKTIASYSLSFIKFSFGTMSNSLHSDVQSLGLFLGTRRNGSFLAL